MADHTAALVEQFLNIPATEVKSVVQPAGMLDSRHGKAVAVRLSVGRGGSAYPDLVKATQPLGVLLQADNLIPHLNVLDDVLLPIQHAGKMDRTFAQALLGQVGLTDRARHLLRERSGRELARLCQPCSWQRWYQDSGSVRAE